MRKLRTTTSEFSDERRALEILFYAIVGESHAKERYFFSIFFTLQWLNNSQTCKVWVKSVNFPWKFFSLTQTIEIKRNATNEYIFKIFHRFQIKRDLELEIKIMDDALYTIYKDSTHVHDQAHLWLQTTDNNVFPDGSSKPPYDYVAEYTRYDKQNHPMYSVQQNNTGTESHFWLIKI